MTQHLPNRHGAYSVSCAHRLSIELSYKHNVASTYLLSGQIPAHRKLLQLPRLPWFLNSVSKVCKKNTAVVAVILEVVKPAHLTYITRTSLTYHKALHTVQPDHLCLACGSHTITSSLHCPFTDSRLHSCSHSCIDQTPELAQHTRYSVEHTQRSNVVLPEEDQAVYLVQDALQRQVSSIPCFILTCTEQLQCHQSYQRCACTALSGMSLLQCHLTCSWNWLQQR